MDKARIRVKKALKTIQCWAQQGDSGNDDDSEEEEEEEFKQKVESQEWQREAENGVSEAGCGKKLSIRLWYSRVSDARGTV